MFLELIATRTVFCAVNMSAVDTW
jgi:hypothetical protein